jgi:hypothetical protein
MIDVSFFLPGIRTHFWEQMYSTAVAACGKYSFEIVIVSPFDVPDNLKNVECVRVIKDFGNPTRCAQIAAANTRGRLLYHTVDDGFFYPGSIESAVTLYDATCSKLDMINMRYREGPGYSGAALPLDFWRAWSSAELQLPGVGKGWRTSLHFLIDRERFVELGGFDAQFEYLNHPLHDFAFRLQAAGGKIYHSPHEVINCTHYPNETIDHGPIHNAQIFHDAPIFHEMYQSPMAAFDRIPISFDNWKQSPPRWERRFGGKTPTTYEEMLNND